MPNYWFRGFSENEHKLVINAIIYFKESMSDYYHQEYEGVKGATLKLIDAEHGEHIEQIDKVWKLLSESKPSFETDSTEEHTFVFSRLGSILNLYLKHVSNEYEKYNLEGLQIIIQTITQLVNSEHFSTLDLTLYDHFYIEEHNMASENYKVKFKTFLNGEVWHMSMVPMVDVLLKSDLTDTDMDNFIQSITKRVETATRETYNKKFGVMLHDRIVGKNLLKKTVDDHLIENKDTSLYSLLHLIITEPRNISHHHFRVFPYKKLVMYTLQCDDALIQLDNLLQSGYKANFITKLDENATILKVMNVEVYTPNNVKLNNDSKIEANIRYPNGAQKLVQLMYASGYWSGEYDNVGTPMGTLSVGIIGYHNSNHFVAQSGATVVARQPDRSCPKCEKKLTMNEFKCSSCGSYIYIARK